MKTMKKILSVCLALVLMAAMFAISASAATTTETPVGKADSGLEDKDFTNKDSSGQNINVTVKEVSHRYAVDLTFSFDDLTIDSTITWNVKDLKYDVSNTEMKDTERTITVTNRSDLPVYAYATAVDNDRDDHVTIETSHKAASRLTVDKATVGSGNTKGNSTSQDLTVTLTSDSWQDVAGYYAAKRLDDNKDLDTSVSYVLTTVTVTISKSATSN